MQRPSSPDMTPDTASHEWETPPNTVARISSAELFGQGREIEIEHHGKIYRLRVTQLNKLILTA
jgi:hemin uptake protein HemP